MKQAARRLLVDVYAYLDARGWDTGQAVEAGATALDRGLVAAARAVGVEVSILAGDSYWVQGPAATYQVHNPIDALYAVVRAAGGGYAQAAERAWAAFVSEVWRTIRKLERR